MHANNLFAVWNLEMLPSSLGCATVPLLIDYVLTKLIENSEAIDVACWIALIDVDISDAAREIKIELSQSRLGTSELSLHWGAHDTVCEVQLDLIQARREAKLDAL